MCIQKRVKTQNKAVAFVGAIILALTMLVMMLPANIFAAENPAVTDASKGVVQVNMVYHADNNKDVILYYGSGFLINSDTVLTCDHVINLSNNPSDPNYNDLAIVANAFGKTEKEIVSKISYTVTVTRDVSIKVSQVINHSAELDFAILKLEQPIGGKEPLTIRTDSEVSQTETVYAIGFPEPSAVQQDINTYTSDDVTITEGIVNKVGTGKNPYPKLFYGVKAPSYKYIQTSVNLNGGNSGGPLVDEDGYVVGICHRGDDAYFYAVEIAQVTDALDALGVEYNTGGPEPQTDEQPTDEIVNKSTLESAITAAEEAAKDESKYSKESFSALTAALENAKAVNDDADADQSAVDQAAQKLNDAQTGLEEKKGLDMKWIIIIAAGVVVIAAVIIIIVVISSKKKKQQAAAANRGPAAGPKTTPMGGQQAPQGFTPPQPPQAPQGFAPVAPAAPASDAGETTVLSSDAGETTVLSQNINGGTLINVKTGEKVQINTAEFVIGRERTKVNYCISGNTSVGRTHAKIVNRNGQSYLVDLRATNGTFVNGVKCTPQEEVLLKSGDKVAFSNEEFTYQA